MNTTTVASKKIAVRTCRVSGFVKLGEPVSVLTIRADMVLTDGSRLSDPHVRTFCAAIKAVANDENLTITSHEGFTDFELTGAIFSLASANRIATLVCGKALESILQHHGSKQNFIVHEISASPC
jgi:hypothetical protein